MLTHSKQFQWGQLITITAAHFIADMFVGMIPGILPAVGKHFRLDISQATLLMGTMFISANFIQVLTGHLRGNKTRPLFLYIGMVLAATTCFFILVPVTDKSIFILLAMIILSGLGVGSIHPESLRAVHTLNKISGSAAIAFFMSGGIAGFALGGYIAPVLVERIGLNGLYWLTLPAVIALACLLLMRIRIAADDHPREDGSQETVKINFWLVFTAAVPLCTATTIFVGLLPTYLAELGNDLSLGGYSIMAYNLGGAIGAFGWAWVASRKSELFAANLAASITLPILVVYLFIIDHRLAKHLLFVAGFCGLGGFPLLVTVARHAKGPNLGFKMGAIVGGTWGVGAVIMIMLGPVAETLGVYFMIKLSISLYPISAILGLLITRLPRRG